MSASYIAVSEGPLQTSPTGRLAPAAKFRIPPSLPIKALAKQDWTSRCPQACVWAMEKGATYDFGEAFARLTCLLEDAAGLATEGQSLRLNAVTRTHLTGALGTALLAAGAVLNEIKAEMDQ